MPLRIVQFVSTSPYAFPLAAVAALAMFFISETSYDRASASLRTLADMSAARTNTQTLWRSLVDAETGQRGYLLTGRKEYLRPYEDALVHVKTSLADLNEYYDEDAEGAPLIRNATRLANEKLSELATTIALRDAGRNDAWRDLLLSNIGEEKMQSVRGVSDQLLRLETKRVQASGKACSTRS